MVKTKGNKTPEQIFQASSQSLFRLLAHHPRFLAGIADLRKNYGVRVPKADRIEYLLGWKNENRAKYHELIQALASLTDEFDVPPQLRLATRRFAEEYVFIGSPASPSMYGVGLNVIRPSDYLTTLKLNQGSVYLEIIPGITSEREVRESWEKIVGKVKQVRNLGVSKTNPIEERVWELTELAEPQFNAKDAAKVLGEEFPNYTFTYTEVNKYRSNYKQALLKLASFA